MGFIFPGYKPTNAADEHADLNVVLEAAKTALKFNQASAEKRIIAFLQEYPGEFFTVGDLGINAVGLSGDQIGNIGNAMQLQDSLDYLVQQGQIVKNGDEYSIKSLNAPTSIASSLWKSSVKTYFNIGDRVRARVTAQGMQAGVLYEIVDINTQSMGGFGDVVNYKLQDDSMRPAFWVGNLQQLADQV